MVTIVLVGQKGTGKTIFMTKIALDNPDIPVYSNYEIFAPNYNRLDFTILPELSNEHFVFFDEAYMYVDSRRGNSNEVLEITHLLFQSRKRKSDYILSLQLDSSLDLRFRNLADLYIMTELQNALYNDDDELISGDFVYHFLKNGNYLGAWKMTFDYAKKYLFGKYDSLQVINTSKDIGKNLSLLEPESEENGINDIIAEMENKLPLDRWDKIMIRDLVMTLRYPIKYADKVYGRVKRTLAEKQYNRGE